MKNAIKTVTFTLDELRNMLDVTLESGDTRAANQVIRRKLSEKAERLARQREQRRLRAEQKKAIIKESENSALSVSSKKTENSASTNKLTISLNRALATCILWINNRRTHLKNNILCLINEVARYTNHPAVKSIESAIDCLLYITSQAAIPAHQYLHSSYRSRPTTATIAI